MNLYNTKGQRFYNSLLTVAFHLKKTASDNLQHKTNIPTFIQRTDIKQLPCQFYVNGYLWNNNYNPTGRDVQVTLKQYSTKENKKLP